MVQVLVAKPIQALTTIKQWQSLRFRGTEDDSFVRATQLQNLDLSERDLSQVRLDGKDCSNTVFDGARLRYLVRTVLNGAKFRTSASGKSTDLREASLVAAEVHQADFTGALMDGARLIEARGIAPNFQKASLKEADLSHVILKKANLDGADLSCANLQQAHFNDPALVTVKSNRQGRAQQWASSFKGARLAGANLSGGNFMACNFEQADFASVTGSAGPEPAFLRNARLDFANLKGANLQGVSWIKTSLVGADLSEAKLAQADFRQMSAALLKGAKFVKARLPQSFFNGLTLQSVNLRGADLRQAHFGPNAAGRKTVLNGQHLEGANLRGADLQEAQLREAALQGAQLQGANLSGADLRGTDLRGVRWDDKTLLTGAIYSRSTKFPEGFKPVPGMVYDSRFFNRLGMKAKKPKP